MKATVESKGPTEIQLNIEVPPEELAPYRAETLKRLAKEVKVPGFRKGKVPAAVLESRIGREHVSQEMLSDALPDLYSKALEEQEIQPLAQPEIEVTRFAENEPLEVTANVQVKPQIDLPEYKGVEVRAPAPRASEEDIDNQLQRIRERHGTLEAVGRSADKGDFVSIDLFGFRHGEPIEGASVEDFVYEVGSARFVPEMDEHLMGKRAGDIVEFNAKLPPGLGEAGDEGEATLKIVVKEVQVKKLPELNDEFAKTASEFTTLAELKEDIDKRISGHKEKDTDSTIRAMLIERLLDRTEIPLPDAMVDKETEIRLGRLIQDLGRNGVTVEQYLESQGVSRDDLYETYKEAAKAAVAADLLLEAVARAEEMEVTADELQSEIQFLAEQMKQDAQELAANLANAGSLTVVAGDILRRKALDFLVENAVVLDESGGEPLEIKTVEAEAQKG
ncbi:MAG: trigger factor [Actinomycetota bacterium]